MTRRSIYLLVTLLVALFIGAQTTVVTAHDVCGDPPGQWCAALPTSNGAGPIVADPVVGNPAENTQGAVSAQLVSARTGMGLQEGEGTLVALEMANEIAS
jgi:hypothetical protein